MDENDEVFTEAEVVSFSVVKVNSSPVIQVIEVIVDEGES